MQFAVHESGSRPPREGHAFVTRAGKIAVSACALLALSIATAWSAPVVTSPTAVQEPVATRADGSSTSVETPDPQLSESGPPTPTPTPPRSPESQEPSSPEADTESFQAPQPAPSSDGPTLDAPSVDLTTRADDSIAESSPPAISEEPASVMAGASTPAITAYESSPGFLYAARTDGSRRLLSYQQWLDLGSPAWSTEKVWILKSPWNDVIRSATPTGTRTLSLAEWVALGSPAPHTAVSQFQKLTWSPTVYAGLNYSYDRTAAPTEAVALSLGTWTTLGSPAPAIVPHIVGTEYFRWASDANEIFSTAPGGELHRLTFAQWKAAGQPAPNARVGRYLSVPWTPTVWFFPTATGASGGRVLSFEEWAAAQAPTPATVGSVPGGTFYKLWGDAEIRYIALGADSFVTPQGWANAGYPAPEVRYPPLFVYGTLRPGESAWNRLASAATSTTTTTTPNGSLYRLPNGTYPFLVPGGLGVWGDLVSIRPDAYAATIASIDAYEGYNPNRPINSQPYVRALITTASGVRAYAWIATPQQAAYIRTAGNIIPTGDWKRR